MVGVKLKHKEKHSNLKGTDRAIENQQGCAIKNLWNIL
jgi:hypothetical protein